MHIGDFNGATRHLTFVERALYRELIDLYYDTEQPLNADLAKLARRVLANTDELKEALKIVLEEFFTLRDDGWHNERCDREIAAYRQKAEQQSRAGRVSAAKRGQGKRGGGGGSADDAAGVPASDVDASTPVERPLNARSTNQEPRTKNQIHPPNPPSGGASGGLAIAAALSSHFPEHRRTRIAEVAAFVVALEAGGEASGQQLLDAAALQAEQLAKDGGKHAPNVLTWLRRRCWLDSAVLSAGGGLPLDWSATRSGIEAMGARLGLPPWEASGYRLLADYEAEVRRLLDAQGVAV